MIWPFSTISRLKRELAFYHEEVRQMDVLLAQCSGARNSDAAKLRELQAAFEDLKVKRNLLSDLVRHKDAKIEQLTEALAKASANDRRDPKTGRYTKVPKDV